MYVKCKEDVLWDFVDIILAAVHCRAKERKKKKFFMWFLLRRFYYSQIINVHNVFGIKKTSDGYTDEYTHHTFITQLDATLWHKEALSIFNYFALIRIHGRDDI